MVPTCRRWRLAAGGLNALALLLSSDDSAADVQAVKAAPPQVSSLEPPSRDTLFNPVAAAHLSADWIRL